MTQVIIDTIVFSVLYLFAVQGAFIYFDKNIKIGSFVLFGDDE
jgi:hypothetical protein